MSNEILQQVLTLLAQQQGNVSQAARDVERAAAPVNQGLRNPGQSGMDVLRRGTPAQRRGLLEAGLGMMAHDPRNMPGASLQQAARNGFQVLDEIRGRQREQNMQQATAGYEAATGDASRTKGYLDTAAQMQHAFGEKPEKDSRTASMKEFEYARQNGFTGSFEEWVNREAIQRQRQAEDKAKAGSTESMNMQRAAAENTLETSQITLKNIDKAMEQANGLFATGLPGQVLQNVGGTDALDLKKTITQIVSTVGFDRLQRMRDESPTGGALGQVSQMELAQLNSALGNLEVSQSEEQLKENLQVVKDVYTRILGQMNNFLNEKPADTELESLLEEY